MAGALTRVCGHHSGPNLTGCNRGVYTVHTLNVAYKMAEGSGFIAQSTNSFSMFTVDEAAVSCNPMLATVDVHCYFYPARACASKGLCDRSWCPYSSIYLQGLFSIFQNTHFQTPISAQEGFSSNLIAFSIP